MSYEDGVEVKLRAHASQDMVSVAAAFNTKYFIF